MQTGGYDVVAEISEKLANKLLCLAYYLGKFPAFKGTYALPIDVPVDLRDFAQVGYEVALTNPPVISARAGGSIVTFTGEAKFTVLGGIEVGTQAEFKLQVTPTFDTAKHTLCISFGNAQIENLELTGFTNVPATTTERLKTALSAELTKYLTQTVGTLELTPSLLTAEDALSLSIASLSASASNFNLAGNILGRQGGNPNAIVHFCGDSHLGVGVTVDAMHRVYDNWWSQTPKVVVANLNHTIDFSMPDWAETADDWLSAAASGFLVSVDEDFTGLEFNLKASFAFNKFNFDFKAGNRIDIAGSLTLKIDGSIDLLSKTTVSVLMGLGGSETIKKKIPLATAVNLPILIVLKSAIAEIGIDSQNRLVAKLVDFDLSIPFLLPDVPDFGLDFVKNWIKQQFIDFVGSIVLAPAIIQQQIPGTDLTVQARVSSLNCNSQEALVGIKLRTLGVGSYAPYVGNKNKDHMEIHTKQCQYAKKIAPKNQVYYCDLEEAQEDGFDGCSFCLHDHHTR